MNAQTDGRTSRTQLPVMIHLRRSAAVSTWRTGVLARKTGSAMFSPAAWERIACNLRLSPREFQIVRGTFDDQTESAIAADLHIAPSTVHAHVGRLHRKLAVTDRAQLILRVMQEYMTLAESTGNGPAPVCAGRAKDGRPLRLSL